MEVSRMEAQQDTFVFYPTFIQQIEAISSVEVRARLYSALAQYGCYGKEPDFSDIDPLGMLDGLFVAIKYAIDESKSHRRNITESRRAAGALGGAPKGNANAQKQAKTSKTSKTSKNNQSEANASKTSVNVNVNENVNGNENLSTDVDKGKKRSKRFVAPSLDEIKSFWSENNFSSDPEAFNDYYKANGWTQGRGKAIKDWEAAARNWERRQSEFSPTKTATPQPPKPTTAEQPEEEDFGGMDY